MEKLSIKNEVNNGIYLDNAATTKPSKEVIDAIQPYLQDMYQNPSSLYQSSQKVSKAIEQAKKDIAEFIGAKPSEIYFTSGGSESNCWAIQGFCNHCLKEWNSPIVLTSQIEHKSIIECAENYCDKSINIETYFVDVDSDGCVDLEQLEDMIKDEIEMTFRCKPLVSIQLANNEIGTIQPIKKIAELVHKYGGVLHTDAVQAVGHLPVNVKELGVDMLSASAHKFNGLKGTGFLYIRDGVKIEPLIYGSQNNGMRGGTENVIGIVAMATALKNCDTSFTDGSLNSRLIEIKRKLIEKLSKVPYNIQINNESLGSTFLPSILSITILENVTAEAVLYMLDSANIQVSSGSACNSKSHKPSYVLKAIGFSDWDAVRTFRISFNDSLTDEDIDRFVDELNKAIKILLS